MAMQLTHKAEAEIYHGDAFCKQKSQELLDQFFLPRGLLPLNDIIEVGCNRSSGFIWLKQKKKKEHRFAAIGRTVLYDTEVTAFIEDRRLRRLTGVKTKEFILSITVSDIFIDEQNTSRITFGTPSGISKSFPVSAFQLQEDNDQKR
ncbi:uncharacterized protein LOC111015720 [Momordica charantia]|uniref:Uncharacterized protein LOC111015720 n=1 Tax=Momordica charantia TaxID=3673 RepID=A0A6J1CZL2_MOMCH|nr:uncharacterized protein LOC111015720 [Momordica charantia]